MPPLDTAPMRPHSTLTVRRVLETLGGRGGAGSMTLRALAVLSLAAIALACPHALAGELVFPVGSPVGLVPPAGFMLSKRVPGFEDTGTNSTIVMVSLP